MAPMARLMFIGSVTALALLAGLGLAFALTAASATRLAMHVAPSVGHPVWTDLREQTRSPKTDGQILTADVSPRRN